MDLRSLGTAHLGSAGFNPVTAGAGSAGLGSFNPAAANLGSMRRDAGMPDLSSFEEMLRGAAARNTAADAGAAPEFTPAPPMSRVSPLASMPGVTIDRDSELFRQCQELETFLVNTLLTSMRNTIQRSGLIEQSFAGQMYEDMLFDEYARHLAQNAGFGLAELAYLELTGQRGRVVLR